MAYSLFHAVLPGVPVELARTMGAECLAQFCLTIALLLMTFYLAWVRGFSPLEMVSLKADAAFVAALRKQVPVS
jgi:hypothetical protein